MAESSFYYERDGAGIEVSGRQLRMARRLNGGAKLVTQTLTREAHDFLGALLDAELIAERAMAAEDSTVETLAVAARRLGAAESPIVLRRGAIDVRVREDMLLATDLNGQRVLVIDVAASA